MKRLPLASLLAVFLAAGPICARAGIITLDFDSLATGSGLMGGPLVTSYGNITVSAYGLFSGLTGDQLVTEDPPGGSIDFDFDVSSITFDYNGRGSGVFTAEVLNDANTVLDSFFDPSTACASSCFDGNVTLSGLGIRSFAFRDAPGGATFAAVDNVIITVAEAQVPTPATLALFGLGLSVLGWARQGAKLKTK